MSSGRERLADRYLDLLESALLHTLYRPIDTGEPPEHIVQAFVELFKGSDFRPRPEAGDPLHNRNEGRDWPIYAPTMIGRKRLASLRKCATTVIDEGIPGDMIEAGSWRGGAGIMLRGVIEALDADRNVYIADSFQGLPKPDPDRYPADAVDQGHTATELAIPREEVEATFERFGLLDDRVRFVEGWFKDTLPGLSEHTWSLVRIDGDLYESTMDGLRNLYPGLAPGGFVVIDDYGFGNCRQAVDDYRAEHGITEEIVEVDWTGIYWRRSEDGSG